ncbi:MAG: hypothetical protein COV45_02985 [Deltaproteobacteria bacterium CG11_big_fil_rev_8_21_14_0_20_47_16]|nr:MAG: hypothetical protein COV45_02985 [Deltaproteobacteria bacterium CG11_big_fil_rev_8_21_14_0_20_47_16]
MAINEAVRNCVQACGLIYGGYSDCYKECADDQNTVVSRFDAQLQEKSCQNNATALANSAIDYFRARANAEILPKMQAGASDQDLAPEISSLYRDAYTVLTEIAPKAFSTFFPGCSGYYVGDQFQNATGTLLAYKTELNRKGENFITRDHLNLLTGESELRANDHYYSAAGAGFGVMMGIHLKSPMPALALIAIMEAISISGAWMEKNEALKQPL